MYYYCLVGQHDYSQNESSTNIDYLEGVSQIPIFCVAEKYRVLLNPKES